MVAFSSLVPSATIKCGSGFGLAVSVPLGIIATSNFFDDTVSVFELAAPQYRHVGTWGGHGSRALMFDFKGADGFSGWMCFTAPGTPMDPGASLLSCVWVCVCASDGCTPGVLYACRLQGRLVATTASASRSVARRLSYGLVLCRRVWQMRCPRCWSPTQATTALRR